MVTAILGIAVKWWAPGFDVAAIQSIETHRNQTLTSIAGIVTNAGSFLFLGSLSILFLLLRRWKRPADDLALVVIVAGSPALSNVVKVAVARPRPAIANLIHLESFSFPSQHATQAAAIYLTIAILVSTGFRHGVREAVIAFAIVIALAVAWSRVYLGVHFPTDVAAGLLLGWSWALLVLYCARPRLPAMLTLPRQSGNNNPAPASGPVG